jgi:hypothetical protein
MQTTRFSRLSLLGLSAAFVATALIGCSRMRAQTSEVVMCPGSSIVVDIGDTPFSIRSTALLTREIETPRFKLPVTLIPRHERWFGSLGLYNAAAGGGHTHVVVEEGLQHFSSLQEMSDWLESRKRQLPVEYTSNGFVVAGRYQTRPSDATGGPDAAMSLQVWQLLVNGERPTGLAGAHDERFKSISIAPSGCTKPKPFVPSSAKTIYGRRYSGRVIDFMTEQELSAEQIERVVRTGKKSEEGGRITFYSEGDESNLYYVTTKPDGSIVEIG